MRSTERAKASIAYVEKRGRTWVVIDGTETVLVTLSRSVAEQRAEAINAERSG